MRRLLTPLLFVASLGLLAGIGLMVFGLLYGPARPGRARLVAGVLITVSTVVISNRLRFHEPAPTPGGGKRLPPTQDATLDRRHREQQNIKAVGKP